MAKAYGGIDTEASVQAASAGTRRKVAVKAARRNCPRKFVQSNDVCWGQTMKRIVATQLPQTCEVGAVTRLT